MFKKMSEEQPTNPWQESIYQVLKSGGIKQVSYVPDAGHAHVIRRVHADPDMRAVVLTTEEEGVALATGAWLGGQLADRLGAKDVRAYVTVPAIASSICCT